MYGKIFARLINGFLIRLPVYVSLEAQDLNVDILFIFIQIYFIELKTEYVVPSLKKKKNLIDFLLEKVS